MAISEKQVDKMRQKWELVSVQLDERSRRIWAGVEALSYGHGGVRLVHLATGMSTDTIRKGRREAQEDQPSVPLQRVRAVGGGRKRKSVDHPELVDQIENLVQPHTKGDPENPLKWTSKSTCKIAVQLEKQGITVSPKTVGRILKEQGYSLQLDRKEKEGKGHEDRAAQFNHINQRIKEQIASGGAAISVDTKKKELVGSFKNNGQEYHSKGAAPQVNVHDFPDKKSGKVAPCGVYDIEENEGWVSVGVSKDTAAFAVNTIREWWYKMGQQRYGASDRLFITADGGGSNSSRSRLWKLELQKLADELEMTIEVCHFPPGTSKWNKIEHKIFCFITQNWRGKPLITHQAIVQLIAHTTTRSGLKIKSAIDELVYEKGVKITDAQMEEINIDKDEFHGEWNYSISPNTQHG